MEAPYKSRQYHTLTSRISGYCRAAAGAAVRLFTNAQTAPQESGNRVTARSPAPGFRLGRQGLGAVEQIAVEQIRAELQKHGRAPDDDEILAIALHHMERDLDSGLGHEVIEELRMELLYRKWRRGNGLAKMLRNNSVQSGTAGVNPAATLWRRHKIL